jgi:hypothetical protein
MIKIGERDLNMGEIAELKEFCNLRQSLTIALFDSVNSGVGVDGLRCANVIAMKQIMVLERIAKTLEDIANQFISKENTK